VIDFAPVSRRLVLAGLVSTLLVPARTFAQAPAAETRELRVPFDHSRPGDGTFPLGYQLLSPFDPRRQTVFVVADGQQFFLTPQAFAPSVSPIFGDAFNVVGVFSRADAPEVQARVGTGAGVDWAEAHRLLRAEQWLDDIEVVRVALLGLDGRIGLYGRSGGGLLVHQFMARHGQHVERVYTQAAVNPFLAARYGLLSDRFWEELAPGEQSRLADVLAGGRYPRRRIARLFQRQNFFVPGGELPAARMALIGELETGDEAAIARRETDYQIDAMAALEASPRGPAIRVRLFEFFAPIASLFRRDDTILRPDLENSAAIAEPLMALLRAGAVPAPTMDFAALHALPAEVNLVAGRWDHTCDYRTQIALAASYPNGRLLLLDDDHVFSRLNASGKLPELVRALLLGRQSPGHAAALASIADLRWSETAPH
jgi:hypothetical protein